MRAYYNEHDRHAAAWLRNLIALGAISFGDVDERDIREVSPADLIGYDRCHFFAGIGVWDYALRLSRWPDDEPVWTGSCPCQPFSVAGKRKGLDDDRHLWPAWFSLARQCRPAVVFGEQVASPDGLRWFDAVHADLEALGYACGAVPFPAAGVGAPHIRDRLYFVADRAGGRCGEQRSALDARRERHADSDGSAGFMAYHNSERRDPLPGPRNAHAKRDAEPRSELGCSASPRRQGGADGREPVPAQRPAAERAGGHVAGFWADAEWIWCRDEKFRPVEPGTFPLVDGAAFHLGSGSPYEGKSRPAMLRGYGNAIVAPAAATFIRAYRLLRLGLFA